MGIRQTPTESDGIFYRDREILHRNRLPSRGKNRQIPRKINYHRPFCGFFNQRGDIGPGIAYTPCRSALLNALDCLGRETVHDQ